MEPQPSLANALRAAEAAVDNEDWTRENLALFEHLLADDPDPGGEIGWSIARGRCLFALGELDEAAQAFEEVRDRAGGVPANIASSQLEKVNRRRAQRDRVFALLDLSPEDLRQAADDARDAERDLGFQVEARQLLVDWEPTSLYALVALGAAQRRNGETAAALATYDQALSIEDGLLANAAAHIGRAAVLRDLGRSEEAEDILRRVLGRHGGNGHAALALAGVLMDRYVDTRKTELLGEVERLLRVAWACAPRTKEVSAAYGRFNSLSR